MENQQFENVIRKFKCPYCGQKFRAIFTMKKHIRDKHLVDNIYCPYCGYTCNDIRGLIIHLSKKHDEYHRNLHYLLSRKKKHLVNKKLFMENGK